MSFGNENLGKQIDNIVFSIFGHTTYVEFFEIREVNCDFDIIYHLNLVLLPVFGSVAPVQIRPNETTEHFPNGTSTNSARFDDPGPCVKYSDGYYLYSSSRVELHVNSSRIEETNCFDVYGVCVLPGWSDCDRFEWIKKKKKQLNFYRVKLK